MKEDYDAVVIGGGVLGASTLFHLAELGCTRAVLLERGALASGGTGKSCAIVRTHYSILSNTSIALRSLAMLRDLASILDDPDAQSGFVNTGYLIVAGEGEQAENLAGNLALQRELGANTHEVTEADVRKLHPLLDVSDAAAIGYEPESGYADPDLTTASFAAAARRRGQDIRTHVPALEIVTAGGKVQGVRTGAGEIRTSVVILATGPWTPMFGNLLNIEIPMEISRHTVMTFRAQDQEYGRELPVVKDLTVENKMYFRPDSGMILTGTGDHGVPIDSPDQPETTSDEDLIVVQGRQIAHRVPAFEDAQLVRTWTGPYDITPDWNPVIDAAPGVAGLYLAFGFSGHGFKLAPMVGRLLAQSALGITPDLDIAPYRFLRFAEGAELVGTYGIGSIS